MSLQFSMKNTIIILVSMFVGLKSVAQSQKLSRWSIALETSMNRFDGDVTQSYNSIVPNSISNIGSGLTVEYNLTRVWSIGAEYIYLPLSAQGSYYSLINRTNNLDMFGSFEMLRLFFPSVKTQWAFHFMFGLGLAFYEVDYRTNNHAKSNSIYGLVDKNTKFNDGLAVTFPVGTLIEYNLKHNISLGFKVQCIPFNKDNLDGRNYWGVNNDFAELAALQLRWNITGKNKSHLRFSVQGTSLSDKNYEQIYKRTNDSEKSLQDSLSVFRDEIKQLKQLVKQLSTVEKNDSVAVNADLQSMSFEFFGAVYFDFDKTDFDKTALNTMYLLAQKMKENPNSQVEIIGYADAIGNEPYNLSLSLLRALKVKSYLVSQYQIDEKRIFAHGKGKIPQPQSPERYNRRCDFKVIWSESKKDDFM